MQDITNTTVSWVFSTSQQEVNKQQTAYGLDATNYGDSMTAFVSKRHQNIIAKIHIIEVGDLLSYEVIETFELPLEFDVSYVGFNYKWKACTEKDDENPQIEGIVVDDADGTLMIAQETVGLF